MIKQIQKMDFNNFSKDFLEKAILETCIMVQTQARELAPVADVNGGALKASITIKTPKINGGLSAPVKENQGLVGSAKEYSIYQEFGTRYMAPQPFLRPAIALVVHGQSTKQVLRNIADEIALGKLKKGGERVKFF